MHTATGHESAANEHARASRAPATDATLAQLEAVVQRGLDTFVEVGDALAVIRERRLYRGTHGTFEDYCRQRWGFGRHRARQLIEAADVVTIVTTGDGSPPANEAQARELAPLLRSAGEAAVVEVARELSAAYGDRLTAGDVRRAVRARLDRRHRDEASAARRDALMAAERAPLRSDAYELRVAAAGELDDLAPGSVDAIVTDPPYGREHLPCYEQLGELAARVLRDGGILACLTGQAHLPEVLDRLREHLRYQWTLSYMTPGPATHVYSRRFNCSWKPVLWFVNGDPDERWHNDVLHSSAADKQHHIWGQDVNATVALVRSASLPGNLVLDPFVGGGTTGVAAVSLRRRFIGSDTDPEAIDTTARRLAGLKDADADAAA